MWVRVQFRLFDACCLTRFWHRVFMARSCRGTYLVRPFSNHAGRDALPSKFFAGGQEGSMTHDHWLAVVIFAAARKLASRSAKRGTLPAARGGRSARRPAYLAEGLESRVLLSVPAIFQPQQTFPTGAGSDPISVAVADVNGDGKPDLIVANSVQYHRRAVGQRRRHVPTRADFLHRRRLGPDFRCRGGSER
jgi:hypothetical protein